jgi:hypothetical protein
MPKKKNLTVTKTVRLSQIDLENLQVIIDAGYAADRSAAIRLAVAEKANSIRWAQELSYAVTKPVQKAQE